MDDPTDDSKIPQPGRRRRRIVRWTALALLVALFLATALCAPARKYEAALVLADMAAGEEESRLERTTPAPVERVETLTILGETREADLYLPGDGPLAALVLVPGVAETGRRDTRLVALARTLARARFAVLVPEMPNLRALRVRSSDGRAIADAFAWLVARPDLAPEGRAGIAGISYALGPAVLAALEPDVRERVRFILGIGGYYSIRSVLAFLTTDEVAFKQESGEELTPHPYAKYILALGVLDTMESPRDEAVFARIVERRRQDLQAPIGDLVPDLTPDGMALVALVENTNPEKIDPILEGLPEEAKGELAALDLARADLSKLEARLILIHGRNDRYVPYTESLALARAAPDGKTEVTIVDALDHVDLRLSTILDAAKLALAIDGLLAERG